MARAEQGSLRFSRIESRRLTTALLISLLLHLGVWGGYELGKKLHWWQRLEEFLQAHHLAKKNPPLAKIQPPPEVQSQIFVDVTQSDPEPPKKTIYYSDKNSHAANPDEDNNSDKPKLNGKQKVTPKTEDTPKFSKLQPSPPPQPQPKPAPQTKPTPTSKPESQPTEVAQASSPLNKGDVKLDKKTADKKTEEQKTAEQEKQDQQKQQEQQQTQPPPRPRTLKEALEQRHLPGQEMQQAGGAHRKLQSALDVSASPLGDYDRAFIEAVQERWYQLLDSQKFAQDRTGSVTIHFRLKYDGSVEQVTVTDNSVGTLLGYVCQAAIEEAAPFAKWPDAMRQMIGENYRDITFTFNYY